jgi:hypothetical protein
VSFTEGEISTSSSSFGSLPFTVSSARLHFDEDLYAAAKKDLDRKRGRFLLLSLWGYFFLTRFSLSGTHQKISFAARRTISQGVRHVFLATTQDLQAKVPQTPRFRFPFFLFF